MDSQTSLPASIIVGATRYVQVRLSSRPDWVVYEAAPLEPGDARRTSPAEQWRAKYDDKKQRPFFVSLTDKKAKVWHLPDLAAGDSDGITASEVAPSDTGDTASINFAPAAPLGASPFVATMSADAFASSSRSWDGTLGRMQTEGSLRAPSPPPLYQSLRTTTVAAMSPHQQQQRLPAAVAMDIDAMERMRRLNVEDAAFAGAADLAAGHTAALGRLMMRTRARRVAAEELRYCGNTEAEERTSIMLGERAQRVLLRRAQDHDLRALYERQLLAADEADARRTMTHTMQRSFETLRQECALQAADLESRQRFRPGPWARRQRAIDVMVKEEASQRALLAKAEAAEVAYIVGREARDVQFMIDRDVTRTPEGGSSLSIAALHREAGLPHAAANELLTFAALNHAAAHRDFAMCIAAIYQEFIRGLWDRPAFFLSPELSSYRTQSLERSFAVRHSGPRRASVNKLLSAAGGYGGESASSSGGRRVEFADDAIHKAATQAHYARRMRSPHFGMLTPPAPASGEPVEDVQPRPAPAALARKATRQPQQLPPAWSCDNSQRVILRPDDDKVATASDEARNGFAVAVAGVSAGVLTAAIRFDTFAAGTVPAVGVAPLSGHPVFGWRADGWLTADGDAQPVREYGKRGFTVGDVVTVTLNFGDLTLKFAVNGDDRGTAFLFSECDDPEPLHVAVVLPPAAQCTLLSLALLEDA
jgi:hypothetical protein